MMTHTKLFIQYCHDFSPLLQQIRLSIFSLGFQVALLFASHEDMQCACHVALLLSSHDHIHYACHVALLLISLKPLHTWHCENMYCVLIQSITVATFIMLGGNFKVKIK